MFVLELICVRYVVWQAEFTDRTGPCYAHFSSIFPKPPGRKNWSRVGVLLGMQRQGL